MRMTTRLALIASAALGLASVGASDEEPKGDLARLNRLIDAQPRTYSVSVMRRIKEDHEGRIHRATSGPSKGPLSQAASKSD